jgi:ABC-type bacteriocin/lantibiotic exporter with double-glycine peptidase domain
MPLEVPYAQQSTPYTCGPAAVRMVLAYFGIHTTEHELMRALGTHHENGTSNERIIEEFETRGLHCMHRMHATLDDVRAALAAQLPVLVNYINPRSNHGHFAVVVAASNTHIILNDPKNGAGFQLHHEEFERLWVDQDGTLPQWMLVAAPEEAHLQKLQTLVA